MNNKAVLYLRSSKDRSDVSIDAQRRDLHRLAALRGFDVVGEFADPVETGKDDDRPGFQSLLHAVRLATRGWTNILTLDTSRVARRRYLALFFERECEKHGVTVHYKSLPDSDPITTMLLKALLQAMDEWHSLTSRAKGLAGMEENIRRGWRAGGRAPRGYRLVQQPTGAVRDGVPVEKSKLVTDNDAGMVACYLKARAQGCSRSAAARQCGLAWSGASLNAMEWQALTYAGHTTWNVHNERLEDGYRSGEKRRPRTEWLVTEDTHEALITRDEAERILMQLERKQVRRTRDSTHPYLLAPLLITPAGARWHGEWDRRMEAAFYRCGRGRRLATRRVDAPVLERIALDLQSADVIGRLARSVAPPLREVPDKEAVARAEKQLEALDRRMAKLVALLAEAQDKAVEAVTRTIVRHEGERSVLVRRIGDMKAMQHRAAGRPLSEHDVRRCLRVLLEEFQADLEQGRIHKARQTLWSLVDAITLDPAAQACTIHYRIALAPAGPGGVRLTGVNVASPRGFEPRLSP